MKHTQKASWFVAGMLSTALLVNTVAPAAAALVAKTIQVHTGIEVFVDDKRIDAGETHGNPDAFLYNGTTYVAVAAISKSLGEPVVWDGNTRSVYIGKHTSDKPAVWLKDLDHLTMEYAIGFNSERKVFDTDQDNLGHSQTNAIGGGAFTYTYLLNDQYSKLTGTLYVRYPARDANATGKVKIYGDGELLYDATISKGDTPIDFSVDLSGVLELSIYFDGYDSSLRGGAGHHAGLSNCGLWT